MHSFLRVIQATQFLKKYFAFQLFKRFDEYSNKNNGKNIHLQIIDVFSLFAIEFTKKESSTLERSLMFSLHDMHPS